MDSGSGADLRMELVQFLSARLPEEAAHELFELASSDPVVFFAELLSLHRSGQLVLPDALLRRVTRDFRVVGH